MTKSQIKLRIDLKSFEETCDYIYQAFLRKLTVIPLGDRLLAYSCVCAEFQGFQLLLMDVSNTALDMRFQAVLDRYQRLLSSFAAENFIEVRTLADIPPGVGAVQGRGIPPASLY